MFIHYFCTFIIVVNENVSLVISRQVLTDVSSRLLFLPDEISMAVSHYTLDKVKHLLDKVKYSHFSLFNLKHTFKNEQIVKYIKKHSIDKK